MRDRAQKTRLSWLLRAARTPLAALGLLGATLLATAEPAIAASSSLEVPPREETLASPAYRYANMTNEEAFAELDRRGVPYKTVGPHGSVRAPVRLTGKLHGVDIHGSGPVEQRDTSLFEVLDARLALALDDFAVILERHDVVELVHYTMYRPNVPDPSAQPAAPAPAAKEEAKEAPKGTKTAKANGTKGEKARPKKKRAELEGKATKADKSRRAKSSAPKKEIAFDDDHEGAKKGPAKKPAAKPAAKPAPKKEPTKKAPAPSKADKKEGAGSKAKKPLTTEKPHGKWAPPGTRHPAGLAIDVGALRKKDGTVLSVAQHFGGKIGDATCGGSFPDGAEGRELHSILCQAKDSAVFTYALTPHYNADHADHFHLEIKPGVEWFMYR